MEFNTDKCKLLTLTNKKNKIKQQCKTKTKKNQNWKMLSKNDQLLCQSQDTVFAKKSHNI